MKRYILLSFIITVSYISLSGQATFKNGVFANFGVGTSGEGHTVQTFTLGYQRSISRNLYLSLEYTDVQGSQSFESFFGESPQPNEFGEFGENYRVSEDGADFGRLLQMKVYTFSICKYIQMAPKIYISGAIGVNFNIISELDVGGVIFETDGSVNYENSYPQFGNYSNVGAKVSLGGMYFINDYVSIDLKASYFSSMSIVGANLGTTVFF